MKATFAGLCALGLVVGSACGADTVANQSSSTAAGGWSAGQAGTGRAVGLQPSAAGTYAQQPVAGAGAVSSTLPPGYKPPVTTPPPTNTTTPPVSTTPPATTPPPTTTTPPPTGTPTVGGADPVIPEVKGECPAFTNSTVTFMGVSGIQIVAGAKAANASAPMVFYWHGTGSSAGEFGFMASAVQQGVVSEGGVLISFQGSSKMGDSSCSGTAIFSLGDMDIADQFLACAVKNHNVDPKRVYATGCSAGGLFSTCMAAKRSAYIAAAAPNSGGMAFPIPFADMHTPALMTIHGSASMDVVGIRFADSSATADKAFKDRGGFVINCDHGGGHCGGGSLAPDIWTFFKAHPFGVTPEPWTALPAGFNPVCKIY